MIVVYQDIFGSEEGNCFPACLASILEIPLADIPNFFANDDNPNNPYIIEEINRFLSKYNLRFSELNHNPAKGIDCHEILDTFKNTYLIVTGKVKDGECLHSVIYLNKKMIHDPLPEGKGLTEIVSVGMLVPSLNPF